MGKQEESARRERRRGYLQSAILGTVAVAGVLAVAMVAPNVVQLLGGFGSRKRRLAEQSRFALTRLAARGHIVFEERDGKKFARITPEGQRVLAVQKQKAELAARAGRRWDRRYRVVIFDIPVKRKGLRDRLRRIMRECGFLQIQKSVWLHPHDCEDLVALIKADLHIGKDVVYMIVESIENDAAIRRHFSLPERR
jgi:DNA-binding transcriptional regulator PaaX